MIRKILATFLILVIAPVIFALSVMYAVFDTYLNPLFYTDEAAVEQIYDVVIEVVASTLEEAQEEQGMEIIEGDRLKELLADTFPPETIVDFNKSIIDQISRKPLPEEIKIDISEIKTKLPVAMSEVITSVIDQLEPCTPDQEAAFTEGATEGDMPMCIPSAMSKGDMTAFLGVENLEEMANQLPDDYIITLGENADQYGTLIHLVIYQNKVFKNMIIGLCIAFIAVIALVIWKPLESVLRWAGATLLISALPMIILNSALRVFFTTIPAILSGESAEITAKSAANLADMMQIVAGFLTERIFWHGAVLGAIGLAFLLISIFVKKED